MKTNSIKALTATFAALALTVAASAVPIEGTLKYNLDASAFSFDSSSVTFPGAIDGKVNDATGDTAGLLGAGITHADFVYDPFGGPYSPLVTANGYSFALETITFFNYVSEGGVTLLNIIGEGVASMAGYDDTWSTWSFAATDNNGTANYAAAITHEAASVADGGTTLATLGFAIVALAVVSRARARNGKSTLANA